MMTKSGTPRLFVTATGMLALLVILGMACIAIDGLRDDVQPSDAGIVLGSKVMPDGRPSIRLQARLDKAAALYRDGMFKLVIVSGGTGVEGFSEARIMADYLVTKRGVPRAAIVLDEHGDTTDATARNSAAIMHARSLASALVVTQYFHITRSRYALQRAGIRSVHTGHANYAEWRDVYSTLRELIALPTYALGAK